MEVRTCPACQTPLAEQDTFCPKCSGPATSTASQKRVSKWMWVLLAVVLGCPGSIVVIGLLATLVIPNVLDKFARAGEEKAKADIAQLFNALNEYAIRNGGQYPESLEVLVTPDETGYRYLQAGAVPKDPWQHAYLYAAPTPDHPDPRVWSHGKDGQPGGDDDIDSRTMSDDR